jgi:uncharacterized protein (DUF3084 family)
MMQIKMSQTKMLQTKMLQTKMLHTKLQHKSRGIHNISLPVHSEDTVYTRSALAFSRKEAQAQTQKEICALKKKVEEREKVIEEKDAVIEERDAVIEERDTLVKQKNETVKEKNGELQRLGQEVLQKSNMVRRLETEGQALKRADTMMELMGLRERGREAYDPL